MAYVKVEVRRVEIVAAARVVLEREGVAGSTLRGVAKEAGIALGTLHHVFPTKELLLQAVIEDVVADIANLLRVSVNADRDLRTTIREAIFTFWRAMVEGGENLQVMQYELTTYALRTAGLEHMARWQYELYCSIVANWCESSARAAGEDRDIDFKRLSRLLVAGMDGLILQYVCDADRKRADRDLDGLAEMLAVLL